jgi:hypothetical protein
MPSDLVIVLFGLYIPSLYTAISFFPAELVLSHLDVWEGLVNGE